MTGVQTCALPISNNYAMMFLSSKINAGLATIHLPLKKVASLLKIKNLHKTFEIIYNTLKNDLAYADPKIGVLGLNPHAGEGGLIGDEEKKIIIPAIKSFSRKIKIEGPFPPDAFWGNKVYENYDAVIGMYHDQVLIPFKLLNFGKGVNFKIGRAHV